MKFQDQRIADEVKEEIEDLTVVMNIVCQIPKSRAERLLRYCMAAILSDKPEALPQVEKLTNELISKIKSGWK